MTLDRHRRDDADVATAPLFRNLPPHFLTAIQTVMERKALHAGETINRHYGQTLFLVERGAVTTNGGPPLNSGAWFGELFATSPVTARAEEDSVILVLRHARFSAFLSRHPGVSMHVLAGLARKLRVATARGERNAL